MRSNHPKHGFLQGFDRDDICSDWILGGRRFIVTISPLSQRISATSKELLLNSTQEGSEEDEVLDLNEEPQNAMQSSQVLKQGKTSNISALAMSNVEHGTEMLSKLEVGLDELQKIIVEDKNWDAFASKQKELLNHVGKVQVGLRVSEGLGGGTREVVRVAADFSGLMVRVAADFFVADFLFCL
ncbi:hypothetical protein DM860_014236 [Cuscuta australis]|uniref:Peptidyl-prolyl cis-trans isomerase CYP38-like PsbQ-like domain-containing protein n=2 Tax=Cuscuta sect. Cleistogrammica TaxID=1824901 RepID=A0A328DD84_9ASTE|nr:hypothetical protein DM860_014236 [Cuscuta australis]